MSSNDWINIHALKTLNRLLPRMEHIFRNGIQEDPESWWQFKSRLEREWIELFRYLHQLYGWQYDFYYTLEQVLRTLAKNWIQRPEELKQMDLERESNPECFNSENMVGGVLYVDLFSGNLTKLNEHISYFKKLGLTYLHLMPIFAVPHGDNDGGYAVSDYRSVNPDIGTMEELSKIASLLRKEGISLALDFVFNHTSDEHAWAKQARSGDPELEAFYHLFPDRHVPDQYQRHLRDIFPTVRRGSFTWVNEIKKWVWTTFHSFQWDLNYNNPEVFRAMAEEMLFLANQGVEVLRLDAVAFIWKRLGTNCENLPEAHILIRAFNAMARIAAPSLLFKSEAIVHPDEVIKYIDKKECRLSYNPLLMALIWEALASRDVRLLSYTMRHRSRIPKGCTWVNYLRCHDDIGWTFDDADARAVGISPEDHRRFLNDFYTGRFPDSFARGVPFQFNEDTHDMRISGTLASLAGLEDALEKNDDRLIEMAVKRINMLRSIMLSIGGIPLIYLGDEWAMINDYTYLDDPLKINDSRWIHRSKMNWDKHKDLADQDTIEWHFFNEMIKLIYIRKKTPAFQNADMDVFDTGNDHLFGFIRKNNNNRRVMVIANFSEKKQKVKLSHMDSCDMLKKYQDLITGNIISCGSDLELEPYGFVWLS
ncbi:MAG: amylosucrase [Desulfobacterales bacterium]|nr:amylosucrase [Desulfobacterales bacterium]